MNIGNTLGLTEIFLDGFIEEELARACVITQNYPNNILSTIDVSFYSPYGDLQEITMISGNISTSDINITQDFRSSPISLPQYWTLHLIGALYSDSGSSETFYYGGNSNSANLSFVFCQTLYDQKYNVPNSDMLPFSNGKRFVTFHEILHSFGIDHDESGIMNAGFNLTNVNSVAGRCLTVSHIRQIQSF